MGMVRGGTDAEYWSKVQEIHNDFAGLELKLNEPIYEIETATNQRNHAIVALLVAYGHIQDDRKMVIDVYPRYCPINVNALDLAVMSATLAKAVRIRSRRRMSSMLSMFCVSRR